MPIRKRDIRDHLFELSDLDSFLKTGPSWENYGKPNPVDQFQTLIVVEAAIGIAETVMGIYVNSAEEMDCIVITNKGIHVLSPGGKEFISYDSIESVSYNPEDDRHLDIALPNGESVSIRILNDTNGTADALSVLDFLADILPFRRDKSQFFEPPPQINTRKDLIKQLRAFDLQNEAEWFENHFDACLEQRKIDRSLLDHPDIWRFCALFIEPSSELNPDDY